tara:strand:- start:2978 stop:3247 length:270 start_codon:yes stop_codon:yes gene_type:complete
MDFHNTLLRYRAIHVRFYGPTNTKGVRIRIKDMRRGDTVWLPYNHEIGDIVNQAGDYLHTQGIGLSAVVLHDTQDGYTLATPDFATPIK